MSTAPPPRDRDLPMPRAKLDNYLSERGALAYSGDHERKLHRRWSDRIERRILAHYLAGLQPVGTLLDLPCGVGRFVGLFAAHADRVLEADISPSMLRLGRDRHPGQASAFLRCSALAIPLADDAVDVVVSVRLSHHLDRPQDRGRHIAELLRVARRAAVFTYFDHASLKNLLRRLRRPLDGKRPKSALRRAEVAAWAAAAGMPLVEARPVSRLGSGHVYALCAAPGVWSDVGGRAAAVASR